MNSKPIGQIGRRLGLAALLSASLAGPAYAGNFTNNFNSDPSSVITIVDPAKWVSSGGDGGTGYISLTDAVGNQLSGSIFIEDLDGGAAVSGFRAAFKMRIGDSSSPPADGWSFNWATDLPSNMGEEGGGTGLTVAFDTYQNAGEDAPEIDIKVGGQVVLHKHMAIADMQSSDFADTLIQYVNGLFTFEFKGITVFKDVAIGLAPISGGRFGFGSHTGGSWETHWLDDLGIQTFLLTAPTIAAVPANAHGITVVLQDAPNAAVDATSVKATVDGAAVTGSATKTADRTVYIYTSPDLYPAGASHDVVLTYKYGAAGTSATNSLTVTVPPYSIVPAATALPAASVDKTKQGFLWRIQKVDADTTLANTIDRAENQLAGALGPNTADPNNFGAADGPAAAANPATAPIEFKVSGVINFSINAGDSYGDVVPNLQMPGLAGDNNNLAADIVTALEFPAAGTYTFIVNSDDDFRTAAGLNPRDVSSPTIGTFNDPAGRGAADTAYSFYVEAAGLYGFRTVYEQGNGGAVIEWLSVPTGGTKVLINDSGNAQAIKAYQLPVSALPAFVRSVSPASGSSSLVRPKTVEAVLVDGSTQVTVNSVGLKLNGATVSISQTKTGGETKVVYDVVGDLLANTLYTAELTYSDNAGSHTSTWTFTTGPLSPILFVIEGEDYDYNGGQANPQKGTAGMDVDVMPYYGGAYDGVLGVVNVDYYNDDGNDNGGVGTVGGDVYRHEDIPVPETDPHHVDMYQADNAAGGNGLGGTWSINSSDRGTYQTTVNYGIGWSGSPDWYNYTRTFPDNGMGGWWQVYALLSYGGEAAGQLAGSFGVVTNGVGTDTQDVDLAGSFSAPGSGGWGANNLVPMKNATGGPGLIKLKGKATVRFNSGSGDYNALILSAAPPPPPYVVGRTLDSSKRNEVVVDWVLKDTDTKVDVNSVKLSFNNQDVTSQATTTKTDTGATVHLDLTGTMFPSGELPWSLTFSDTGTPPQTVTTSGTYVVNPYPTDGVFTIEAEDYNYESGKTNPQKGTDGMDVDVMPYDGGAYDSLLGVLNVDYYNTDILDGDVYRHEDSPLADPNNPHHVDLTDNSGSRFALDRGTFQLTIDYRIGWSGNTDWCNYTRTIPKGDYNVWAALSYGDTNASELRATLALVTSDPTKPNQTTQPLGAFNGYGSGGWGRNELVPMKDTTGQISTVSLAGVQTFRFTMDSGDYDYFLLVPTTPSQAPAPQFTKVGVAGSSITIEWTGGGTLIASDTVNGTYSAVAGNPASPATVPTSGKARFFRIQR